MRIDSHQHFWIYNERDYGWIGPSQQKLRRNFLPPELEMGLAAARFSGSVAVQARQTVSETEWLLELASSHAHILGVVGWVDLRAEDVAETLARFSSYAAFRGVRHAVQDEPDDDFMLRADFRHGIEALRQFGLAYDLLIFPRHLENAIRLVREFPEQRFVVDHIAKPSIRNHVLEPWRRDLSELATYENVSCKLSGMVTEADWGSWTPADFRPYLDVVLSAFGADRLMIGSDWPVCTVAGSYERVMELTEDYIAELPVADQRRILGDTCASFYQLSVAGTV